MGKTGIAATLIWGVATGCTLFAQVAVATFNQPGTLDPTWGASGVATTDLFGMDDVATAVARQHDGKIIVAGYCDKQLFASSIRVFCAVRYLPSGVIDTSFSASGKLFNAVSFQGFDQARAIALQPDGKIVLAGICVEANKEQFCLARYDADAKVLDPTFTDGRTGAGTVATLSSVALGGAFAVAIQPDGKILVAGHCSVSGISRMCALRYTGAGKLDSSFNGGAPALALIGAGDVARSVLIQSDGKIVLAGYCQGALISVFCAARFESNGQLDSTFGGTGTIFSALGDGGNSAAYAAALQADGKIVLAGKCDVRDPDPNANALVPNFCAARYNAEDGSLDVLFNASGSVATILISGAATSVAVQPDGKIVLAGTCGGVVPDNYCVVRHRSDGGLDKGFNRTGFVNTLIPNAVASVEVSAMLLQPDGKIVVAGRCQVGSGDFCVLRYDGGPFGAQNCKLDIDGDGSVLATTDLLIATRVARGMTETVSNGINFPPNATRKTWVQIRNYLVSQCNMSLPLPLASL
jgi:uncharacterized delta-60 repeat protein